MAATDQVYRNQKTLNIVFSVSCVLTLLVTFWMLWDDYNKPYKEIQREFRDVETLVNERAMLARLPEPSEVEARLKTVEEARANLKAKEAEVDTDRRQIQADRDKATAEFQRIKADLDSITSYHDLEVEKLGHAKGSEKTVVEDKVKSYKNQIADLTAQLAGAQKVLSDLDTTYKEKVGTKLDEPQKQLTKAQEDLKKVTDTFTRLAKVTAEKRWKMGDSFRDLPIIDGFAPPTKINQVTLADLPIDYGGFKDVTRYDRCMTCHLGIERSNYTRDMLDSLGREPDLEKLRASYRLLRKIENAGETLGFDPEDINPDKMLEVKPLNLTQGQVTMYAAHPRLDLFVDSNSPHSAEKFGCSACHGGQGSATDFNLASHTPNDAKQMQRWMNSHSKDSPDSYHWHANHYWDFPMMPKRFAEATCLKCHHQVTDTVRGGNREEAPKLLQGYELIRENGCFGCHEIAGQKGGRSVGPDMRLEPVPTLEWLSPADREKARADAQNPPGTFRKVGPGLRRLDEKTNADWVSRWIKSPRGFREDTKMPHFYGLSTNSKDVLPEDQKQFPDAEMYAITRYLMTESNLYLQGKDSTREVVAEQVKRLEKALVAKGLTIKERKELVVWTRRQADLLLLASPTNAKRINDLVAEQQLYHDQLTEIHASVPNPDPTKDHPRKAEIDEFSKKLIAVAADLVKFKPVGVATQLIDSNGDTLSGKLPDADPKQALVGRKLFTERGCMACHAHDATSTEAKSELINLPAVSSEANFGPNLSRLTAKITKDEKGRRWLVQWLLNPNIHSPRTKMPVTHLSVADATGIADWLLSLDVKDWSIDPADHPEEGADRWSKVKVDKPDLDTLQKLAVIYLKGTAVGKTDAAAVAADGLKETHKARFTTPDADEFLLDEKSPGSHEEKLFRYVGKKAIGRLGCYGCHDIPGFETAKPIGTPLNDWGKKDGERLAFEDSSNYVAAKYHIVDTRDDAKDPNKPSKDWVAKDGKRPYEKIFADALKTHGREGFLSLKLADPRSYDYERLRNWEDRLRMPQFRFARVRKQPKEEQPAYDKRRDFEEAKARDSVMTFVLGLVAEPIPMKYVNQPKKERLDEVKGLHVLEKYNCTACHHVRPGSIEFTFGRNASAREDLINNMNTWAAANLEADHPFPSSNAWNAHMNPAGKMVAHSAIPAFPKDEDGKIDPTLLNIQLSDALRFQTETGETRTIRAGQLIQIPTAQITRQSAPYGGTWTNLMEQWLEKFQKTNISNRTAYAPNIPAGFDKPPERYGALPPPLLREGERVQSQWLYQFLLDPQMIRPTTVLRMPRFNMSEEEARILTNYFTAVSRLNNPGVGVTESYVQVPQKDPTFWADKTRQYLARYDEKSLKQRLDSLAPIWDAYLKDEIKEKQRSIDSTEALLKTAPADQKDALTKQRDTLKTELEALQKQATDKDYKALDERWRSQQAYATDSYRLLKDQASACITCHSIGNMKIVGERGPNLGLVSERLRPEWTEQWIANPGRMMSYTPVMPVNFPANADAKTREGVMKAFHGSDDSKPLSPQGQRERVGALRDVLFDLQRISNLPANRYSEK